MDDNLAALQMSEFVGGDALVEGSKHRTMAGVFRIPDEMWQRIEPLIPEHVNSHRFGGGRPRVPDRVILDGIFFVLRTGCQWRALDATGICSGSTAHDRFQEWQQAGFFDARWKQALRDYDEGVECPRFRGHLNAWVCRARREGCGVHAAQSSPVPRGVPS